MAAVTKIMFKLLIPEIVEAAQDQPNKWQNSLTTNAVIINDRRKEKVPDSGTYADKVAGPSSQGFAPMIDASFITRKGKVADEVIETQAKNMGESFDKYDANLNYAFETVDGVPAKRFKDSVAVKKTNWALGVADRTLRMTGDRIRGLGAAPICAYILTADPRVLGMLREGDRITEGAIYDVSLDSQQGSYRTALEQMLIRAGLAIVRADFSSTRLTAMNALVAQAANAFLDEAKADVFQTANELTSFLKFIVEDGLYKISGKVTLTAP